MDWPWAVSRNLGFRVRGATIKDLGDILGLYRDTRVILGLYGDHRKD